MPARKSAAKKSSSRKTSAQTSKRGISNPKARLSARDIPIGTTSLGKAWEGLKNLTVDLTTVDVTTLQCNVTLDLSSNGPFNPSDFFKSIQAKIQDGSTLSLVAHTHVDFDLDSVMISKPEADSKLLEAHNKAVQTAIDARLAVVRIAKEFVQSI